MKRTISDVARLSGVSTGTVSRVLNNRPGVKPTTREKVLRVIKEVSYIPESAARDLPRGRSLTIGIHIYEKGLHLAPFSVLFFHDIMKRILEKGGRLIDLPSMDNGLPCTNVDGIILHGAHKGDPRIDFLEKKNIPYVLIGHDLGKSWISPNDIDGGRQVAKYLVSCGHSSFLHITGRLDSQCNNDRYKGFVGELSALGVDFLSSNLISNVATSLEAYRAFNKYIISNKSGYESSTAIFASSDEITIGVIAAIEDSGKSVPADYSIVGYDDMPEIGNSLTTIHQNIPRLAATALELLLEQINGKEPRSVTLPVQLIIRNSSGINIKNI